MKPLLVALPGNMELAAALAGELGADVAQTTIRQFPDGESYVRFESDVAGRDVVLACTLDRPDSKTVQLLFAARAAREIGARSVGLVAPYLAYMRQDARFHPGEGVSSRYFAALLGESFDWLVTVDPHLHRYAALDEVYPMAHRVVHAAPRIAEWIGRHVPDALLVGPDSESRQWVEAVAFEGDLPFVVLEKVRNGDRDVAVDGADLRRWQGHTPVILDDIISTARTMIETVHLLRRAELRAPVCVGVHGLFADDALDELLRAGAHQVVTCNTVVHPTNAIDVHAMIASAVRELLGA